VIDRDHLDFERLYRLPLSSAFFVICTIKAFDGITENAVKTQIWIAVLVYVLVAIVRKRLGLEGTLYQILKVFHTTLSSSRELSILRALQACDSQNDLLGAGNHLILFDF
jgi:membrane-associated PAP2 superfamily phosphatase